MKVGTTHYRTVWMADTESPVVEIIDQRLLPFEFMIEQLHTVAEAATAIRDMYVRGAGCIGATAGYAMVLAVAEAMQSNDFDASLRRLSSDLVATRPTATNLSWAVDRQLDAIAVTPSLEEKLALSIKTAETIANEDADWCRRIGEHGLEVIRKIAETKNGQPVNILTHCNAGWLAFVDYGSATAPIYAAHDAGIPVHVWVDETRPRNQGARLTAWELAQHGVPHTLIVDNAGGHLMQHNMVDLVITGTDRTTRTGDVANKIGTYLKAVAARDNQVPFYVALPSSTFDWKMRDGIQEIPIEQRDGDEVLFVDGYDPNDDCPTRLCIAPAQTQAGNFAFDVTPARLVTGLITERGICNASEDGITSLFPEQA